MLHKAEVRVEPLHVSLHIFHSLNLCHLKGVSHSPVAYIYTPRLDDCSYELDTFLNLAFRVFYYRGDSGVPP